MNLGSRSSSPVPLLPVSPVAVLVPVPVPVLSVPVPPRPRPSVSVSRVLVPVPQFMSPSTLYSSPYPIPFKKQQS